MKYLHLFATDSEFQSVKNSLETPYVCYVEETGELYYQKDASQIIIMTPETNPSVFAICYAQGWCSSTKMTLADAAKITDVGTIFANSGIGDFTEFQYFTGLTSLAVDAFNKSTVTKLYMPPNITSLGSFQRVNNLTELRLPENLSTITGSYFGIPTSASLYIGKQLQHLGIKYGFTTSYSNIEISEENNYLTMQDGIVYNNTGVPSIEAQTYNSDSVTIMAGTTTIPDYLLNNDSIVSSLVIPASVTSIGSSFCRRAGNLSKITCSAIEPPTVSTNKFLEGTNSLSIIEVPATSVAAYKEAEGWSTYSSIITAIQE